MLLWNMLDDVECERVENDKLIRNLNPKVADNPEYRLFHTKYKLEPLSPSHQGAYTFTYSFKKDTVGSDKITKEMTFFPVAGKYKKPH